MSTIPSPVKNGQHLNVEQIAQVCHETNRAYCQTIGDDSQPTWENAPEWQKKSAQNGVIFHIENPLSNPWDSHENWVREKRAQGWVFGPVKDPEKKEHPCMVPFHQLPMEQQMKDQLFISIVKSFVEA